MQKSVWLTLGTLLVAAIFMASTAAAEVIWREGAQTVEKEMVQEGGNKFQVGKLRVIPALQIGGTYDSNIYLGNDYTKEQVDPSGLVAKPVESDYILNVQPGLALQYDMGARGKAVLGYEGQWAFYKEYTAQNWNNQRGLFDFDYMAPAGFILGIKNVYDNGNDPYGDATQFALGLTKRRWRNDLNTKIGWDFSDRFRIIGYYDFYKQKYKDSRDYTQNWTDNGFGIGGQMRVMPKTWAFIRYHYIVQDFYSHPGTVDGVPTNITSGNDASNKKSRVSVGLQWDGAGKLGGEVNFGYQWLSWDNDVDSAGSKRDNVNTWVAATSIDYRATANTTLSLNIARRTVPTNANSDEYFDDTQVGFNVVQQLPYKFSATAGFVYGRNDYNTQANPTGSGLDTGDRTDNNYNAHVQLTYQIQRWLNTGLRYQFRRKDSNSITQSFSDHQVMLTVGAAY